MNRKKESKKFYDWLRTHFNDLESAKKFYFKWVTEMEQLTPFGCFSLRAMAGHMSYVLEGYKYYPENGWLSYTETEHGSQIYLSGRE